MRKDYLFFPKPEKSITQCMSFPVKSAGVSSTTQLQAYSKNINEKISYILVIQSYGSK